jgi:hypothetical protein
MTGFHLAAPLGCAAVLRRGEWEPSALTPRI